MSIKKKLWLAVIAALFLSLVAGISISNAPYLNNHPQTLNAVKLVDQSVNDNASSVVVFWLKGCPYCNKALPNIVKEADQSNFDSLAQQSAFMSYARYVSDSGVVLSMDLKKWYRTFRHDVLKPMASQKSVVHIRHGYRKSLSSKAN